MSAYWEYLLEDILLNSKHVLRYYYKFLLSFAKTYEIGKSAVWSPDLARSCEPGCGNTEPCTAKHGLLLTFAELSPGIIPDSFASSSVAWRVCSGWALSKPNHLCNYLPELIDSTTSCFLAVTSQLEHWSSNPRGPSITLIPFHCLITVCGGSLSRVCDLSAHSVALPRVTQESIVYS